MVKRQENGTDGDRRSVRDLAVVGWSHAGQHAFTAGLGIAIPFVISAFHTSYAVVGLLLSIAAISGNALQALSIIVRRTSAKVLFTIQNIGSTAGAVLAAIAPSVLVLTLGRFVQSAAGWPQHPIGGSYLSRRYPNQRGRVLSWHVTAGNIGTLLAPLVIPAIIVHYGWRGAFWFLAVMLASTALVVALWLPASWHRLSETRGNEGQTGSFWRHFRLLIGQRPVFALVLAGTIAAGGQGIGIVGVYSPGYLHSALRVNAFELSLVLTILYIGAVIGPVLMGVLADRYSHRGALLVNYVLGAVFLIVFVLIGRGTSGLALAGLGIGIFTYSELSLRQTVFSDYLPDDLARAGFGLFFMASQSIGSIWIAVIGWVVTASGFLAAFLLMALSFLIAAVVVAIGTRQRLDSRHASA